MTTENGTTKKKKVGLSFKDVKILVLEATSLQHGIAEVDGKFKAGKISRDTLRATLKEFAEGSPARAAFAKYLDDTIGVAGSSGGGKKVEVGDVKTYKAQGAKDSTAGFLKVPTPQAPKGSEWRVAFEDRRVVAELVKVATPEEQAAAGDGSDDSSVGAAA